MPRPYRATPGAVVAAALLAAVVIGPNLPAQELRAAPMSASALRTRLEAYTADSMRGRLTGTDDHRRAVTYIADELRAFGLRPGGDDGGFLQRVPLSTVALDTATATLIVSGSSLRPYRDYLPRNQGTRARAFENVPSVFAGVWGSDNLLSGDDARGKVVVIATPPNSPLVAKLQAQARYAEAAAIAIVNFDELDVATRATLSATSLQPAGAAPPTPEQPAYLHLPTRAAAALFGVRDVRSLTPGRVGAAIRGSIVFRRIEVASYNVVAILPGRDPVLREEFVAIGAHSDHVGVGVAVDHDSLRAFHIALRRAQLAAGGRVTPDVYAAARVDMDALRRQHPTPRRDSIYNGADDDGSGAMGLLEVARAMATDRTRPKRSVLFVWHTGEELGLFGAEYFTDHPPVPRDRIVAQINMDMIGRGGSGEELNGGPNYLQLIGSRRLSTELGDLVEQVNRSGRYRWDFDYQYDAPGHPEQFYCRSDHYMYARYGIPVVFMTTGSHADYHQVTDEVQYIDFAKLAKVTRFARDLARSIADRPRRPTVDRPRPNPRGTCIQ